MSNNRASMGAGIPPGGELVGRVGIINWDGTPEVRLRSERNTTNGSLIRTLPFSTHVQVIKRFPDGWSYIATPWGQEGFVASSYLWTNLPEPGARLHRVEKDIAGTAIAISESYYGDLVQWGQDLRFFVNVLGLVNRKVVPSGSTGWQAVRFQAGDLIWVPDRHYAQSLLTVVDSGSISYDFLHLITTPIARFLQLCEDYGRAIRLSLNYLREAVARHARKISREVLESLAVMVVVSIGVLMITSGVGGAVGFFAGGVGAAPGAAIGFKCGLFFLEWLGLASLGIWLGASLYEIGTGFARFIDMVWNARGEQARLELAARQYAETLATLLGTALEAVLMLAAARGTGWAVNALRRTPIGRSVGENNLGKWLGRTLDDYKEGFPGRPREVLGRYYRRVELCAQTRKGNLETLGEFDGIDMGKKLFIEYKSARRLSSKAPHGGQTPEGWAKREIFKKTDTRISNLLTKATHTRPLSNGSPEVPSLKDIQSIRSIQFRIDGNTAALRSAVTAELHALRIKYPDWTFGVRFGVNLLLPPVPDFVTDELEGR